MDQGQLFWPEVLCVLRVKCMTFRQQGKEKLGNCYFSKMCFEFYVQWKIPSQHHVLPAHTRTQKHTRTYRSTHTHMLPLCHPLQFFFCSLSFSDPLKPIPVLIDTDLETDRLLDSIALVGLPSLYARTTVIN